MENDQIRENLDRLKQGAKVSIVLEDGTKVSGTFNGVDEDQVHLEGGDDVEVAKVENVLMDVSSGGVE